MKIYSIDITQIQDIANDAVRIFAQALANDGLLDADETLSKYAIIAFEKGMLGRFLDELFEMDEKGFEMRVVKL